jgi:murein DD-endopeptidase MepM/ murein hydrolase activator NlpD
VDLRWRLAEGTRLQVHLTQTTATETTIKDRTTSVTIETGLEMLWTVERVDADGTLHIAQSFARFTLKSTGPDGKTSVFDSSSPPQAAGDAGTLGQALRPLLRLRFSVALSPRGEVLDVKPPPETESLLADLPALSPWKRLITKQGLERTLRPALGILPETPVRVGDRWSSTSEVDSPLGKILLTSNYTYDGTVQAADRSLERIRAEGEVKLAGEAPIFGGTSKLPAQQQHGLYLFDRAAGHLVESRLTQSPLAPATGGGPEVRVQTSGSLAAKISPTDR